MVAFPLRLVEELVGRGLLRKLRITGSEVQQIHRQRGGQVRLDDDHQRLRTVAILDLGHRQTGLAGPRSQITQRTEGGKAGKRRIGRHGPAQGFHKADLGAQVDSRLAHQVLEVAERIVRIGPAIRHHDHRSLLGQQGEHAGVLEMPAVRQEPVAPCGALEAAEGLAQQADGLRHRSLPRGGHARPHRLRPPVAETQPGKGHQRREPAARVLPQARRHCRTGDRHPGAEAQRSATFGLPLPAAHPHANQPTRCDRQQLPAPVAVEEAAARVSGLIHTGIDEMHRPAEAVRRIVAHRDIVVVIGREHRLLQHARRRNLAHRLDRAQRVGAAEAPRVCRAQVTAHQPRAVEGVERREVEELEIPPGGKEIAQRRKPDCRQHRPRLGELHRRAAPEHRAQPGQMHDGYPPRAQQEGQQIAGRAPDDEHPAGASTPRLQAGERRQEGAQRRRQQRQQQPGVGDVAILESDEPRRTVDEPREQDHARQPEHPHQRIREAAPHSGLAQPQPITTVGFAQRTAQQGAAQRQGHQPGRAQGQRRPQQHRPYLAARRASDAEQRRAQLQHGCREREEHRPMPEHPRAACNPRHHPIGRGQKARAPRERQQQQPGRRPPRGQSARPVEHQRGPALCGEIQPPPDEEVEGCERGAQQQGQRAQFEMHGDEVANEHRRREEAVRRPARNQIAPVRPHPPREPARLTRTESGIHRVRLRPAAYARHQAPEQAADVATARHGGQQIETLQQPTARQGREQPEAEGRAAYAPARQRQPPLARDIVAAAPHLHQFVDRRAHPTSARNPHQDSICVFVRYSRRTGDDKRRLGVPCRPARARGMRQREASTTLNFPADCRYCQYFHFFGRSTCAQVRISA